MSRRPVPRPVARGDRASRWLPWSEATRSALYGHGGFFHSEPGPAAHFRTSVHASGLFAVAVVTLLERIDIELGRPERLDLVDVGAGRGELLLDVARLLERPSPVSGRVRLHGVDLAQRPPGLPPQVGWSAELPEHTVGLVFANEWLDNVPLDVVEAGPDGPRRVLVDPATGDESPGGPIGLRDASWLARWWPLDSAPEGSRAEVGFPRDVAWGDAVGSLDRGLAVAVDYGHLRADRSAGTYADGTLAGYRDGRRVRPVPDGSCDLSAYVALDACAAAGEAAGGTRTELRRQRDLLPTLLGKVREIREIGEPAPGTTAESLARASELAELTDPAGLGAFWWLTQAVSR